MIASDFRKWGSGECRYGFGVGHPASSLIFLFEDVFV